MLIAGRGEVFSEGLVLGHPCKTGPRERWHHLIAIVQRRQWKERRSQRTTRSCEVGRERVRIEGRGCSFSTEVVHEYSA